MRKSKEEPALVVRAKLVHVLLDVEMKTPPNMTVRA